MLTAPVTTAATTAFGVSSVPVPVWLGIVAEASRTELYLGPLLLATVAVAGLVFSYRRFQQKRQLENIPTASCDEVAFGRYKLKGTAIADDPVESVLTEKPSVHFHYRIKEQYKKTAGRDDNNPKIKWKTIDAGSRRTNFELEDPSGRIRVIVDEANFEPATVLDEKCTTEDELYYAKGPERALSKSTGRRHFTEDLIEDGQQVYVIGETRVREDTVEPEIAGTEDSDLLTISTEDPNDKLGAYRWQSLGAAVIAVICGTLTVALYASNAADAGIENVIVDSSGGFVFAVGFILTTGVLATYVDSLYNDLRKLKKKIEDAQAMIDAQYKRRAQFIPRLVDVVQEVAAHEQQQLQNATQRQPAVVSPKFNSGSTDRTASEIDDQTRALKNLFSVADSYPQLQTNPQFLELLEELVKCEKRILLIQRFHNATVKRLDDRLEMLPEQLEEPLDSVAGIRRQKQLKFNDFEDKPVDIELTRDETDEFLADTDWEVEAEPVS